MKVLFSFILIQYSSILFSQRCATLECLEEKFRTQLQSFDLKFKGNSYKPLSYKDTFFDAELDSLLATYSPVSELRTFSWGSLLNSKYVDCINSLELIRQSGKLEAKTWNRIISDMNGFPLKEKALIIHKMQEVYFTMARSDIDKADIVIPKLDVDLSQMGITSQIELLRSTAKMFSRINEYESALKVLYSAKLSTESLDTDFLLTKAGIEEDIANIYSIGRSHPFQEQGILHYEKAAKYYRMGNHKFWASIADLKKALLLTRRYFHFDFSDKLFLLAESGAKMNIENIDDSLHSRKTRQTQFEILSLVEDAQLNRGPYSSMEYYRALSRVLAVYYAKIEDLETAKGYLNILARSITVSPVNMQSLLDALLSISYYYAFIEDHKRADKYIRYGSLISRRINDKLWELKFDIMNADNHLFFGQPKQTLEILSQTKAKLLGAEYLQDDYDVLSKFNEILSRAYEDLGDSVSSLSYEYKQRESYIEEIEMFDNLSRIEREGETIISQNALNRVNFRLDSTVEVLNRTSEMVTLMKREARGLRNIRDSLDKANGKLRERGWLLKAQNLKSEKIRLDNIDTIRSQNTQIEESIKRAKRNENFGFVLMGISLFLGVVALLYWRRSIEKGIKIRNTREELEHLAKAKIHNIKSNYSTFSRLIHTIQYEKAREYATSCTSLFAFILEKWEVKYTAYSFQDEWETLLLFNETEQIHYDKQVYIDKNLNGLDGKEIRFIPDVLTTLFHNSIKHGFRYKKTDCRFSVNVFRDNNLLVISVSDNGKPADKAAYFRNPKRGLSILRKRVHNLFEDSALKYKSLIKVDAIPSDFGTTIKIFFPYAIPTKDTDN